MLSSEDRKPAKLTLSRKDPPKFASGTRTRDAAITLPDGVEQRARQQDAAAVVLAVIVDDVFGVVEERVKPQENGELWADAVPAIASDAITSAVDARACKRRLVCILIFRFSGRLMPEGTRSETA